MSFSLFRRPGSVVMLDDDLDFLEVVRTGLPRLWHTTLFTEPDRLLRHLKQEPPFWEADAWNQQQIVRKWSETKASLPTELISYWSKYSERFALTKVCIVDQIMPGITGLEVLRLLDGWHGLRVLLTGHPDDAVAVGAFNEGIIDRFSQKQVIDLQQHITDLIQELQDRGDGRLDQIWRATLSAEQWAAVQQPGVARSLAEFLRLRLVEYALIGQPFGVLGLSASGQVGWVPLTQVGQANSEEISDQSLRGELGLATSRSNSARPVLFGDGQARLAGAFFTIPDAMTEGAGYAKWMARQSPVEALLER